MAESHKSISIVTALNVAGGVVSAINLAVLAFFFQTTRDLEVYWVATQIMSVTWALTQSGKIGELYLPIYLKLKSQHSKAIALQSAAVMINWLMAVAIFLSLALIIASESLVGLAAPGFSQSDHNLAADLLRATVPLVALQVITSAGQNILHAEKRFGEPELASLASKVVAIIPIVIGAGQFGIWAAVVGLWASALLQACAVGWLLARLGYRHHWAFKSEEFNHKQLLGQSAHTLGYTAATQIYFIVLGAALSLLPQGSYAIFRYAEQLHSKIYTVMIRPVSIVFFTAVSEDQAAAGEKSRDLTRSALNQGLAIFALAVAGFSVGGIYLIAALLGVGQLGQDGVRSIAILLLALIGLQVIMLPEQIFRKVAIAIGSVYSVYWSYAACQVISSYLAWLFVAGGGLVGAFASYLANALLMALTAFIIVALKRKVLLTSYSWIAVAQWTISGVVGSAVGHGIINLGPAISPPEEARWIYALWGCGTGGLAMISTFATALLLGNKDARGFAGIIAKLVTK
jgi:putative peptidoglycan lipid II flippase